jgi:hypothetical protein
MVKKVVCYESNCVSIEIEDGKKVSLRIKGSCPLPARDKLKDLGPALTEADSEVKVIYEPPVKPKKEKEK